RGAIGLAARGAAPLAVEAARVHVAARLAVDLATAGAIDAGGRGALAVAGRGEVQRRAVGLAPALDLHLAPPFGDRLEVVAGFPCSEGLRRQQHERRSEHAEEDVRDGPSHGAVLLEVSNPQVSGCRTPPCKAPTTSRAQTIVRRSGPKNSPARTSWVHT